MGPSPATAAQNLLWRLEGAGKRLAKAEWPVEED